MATDRLVTDIAEAMSTRARPSVVTFNRLEGRPRTDDWTRALRAEARDALWFLARQWQVGEFAADDAGSPVIARVHAQVAALHRYAPPGGPALEADANLPLEAVVERRPVPMTIGDQAVAHDLRLLAGRRFLRMLPTDGLVDAFIAAFPVREPDPGDPGDAAVCAHPDAWSYLSAVAGQAMDGYALIEAWRADPAAALDRVGLSAADDAAVRPLLARFDSWWQELLLVPDAGQDGWLPERVEYGFTLDTAGPDPLVLTGDGYAGGRLDWYDVDVDRSGPLIGPPGPAAQPIGRSAIPAPATFAGMPNPRWWTFEDGATDLGAGPTDTTNPGRLLAVEFALAYGNDWFVVPLTLPGDCLVQVPAVAVTSVFGERILVEPAGSAAGDGWQRWGLFGLSRTGPASGTAGPAHTGVLVLPSADVLDGPPLEEVELARDEMANMVWGIETRVPLAHGRGVPGGQAAADTRALFERLAGTDPAATDPDPVAPIRYRLMSAVPENWIPFVPVHTGDSARDVALRRAAVPRLIDGGPQPPDLVRPRTSLLRPGLDEGRSYDVHEQEVPRSGTRLRLRYQRARGLDGRPVVWLGVDRNTGRGEGSSGLRFDRAEPPSDGGLAAGGG